MKDRLKFFGIVFVYSVDGEMYVCRIDKIV